MPDRKIKKVNLAEELKCNKKRGGKTIKIPLVSNIRVVNGETFYEIEDYIETPEHWVYDDDSVVH